MVDTASAAQRELPELPRAAYSLDLNDGHPVVAYSVQQMYDFANDAIASRPAVQQEGWVSVDERLPDRPWTEVLAYPVPTDYICTAYCDSAGNWTYAEYEHNFGQVSHKCKVTHWMPLPPAPNLSPATPRPEDVSQKSGKDATYWHDRYCTEKKERKDWQERAELAEKALIDKKLEEKP